MSEVTNFTYVPSFDGNASSLATYEEKVISRTQTAYTDPAKRAANLLLHMADTARKVFMTVGKDCVGNNDGAQQISRIFRERLAPDAVDAIYQEEVKFMNFKRTDQTTGGFWIEFDVLSVKAEA